MTLRPIKNGSEIHNSGKCDLPAKVWLSVPYCMGREPISMDPQTIIYRTMIHNSAGKSLFPYFFLSVHRE